MIGEDSWKIYIIENKIVSRFSVTGCLEKKRGKN